MTTQSTRSPARSLEEVIYAATQRRDPVQLVLAKNIAPGLSDEQWRSLLSGLRQVISTHFVTYCEEGRFFTITAKRYVEHLSSGLPHDRR
jgi:hypothetical protein